MLLLDYIHQSFSHRPYTFHMIAPLGVMGNTRASMTLKLLVTAPPVVLATLSFPSYHGAGSRETLIKQYASLHVHLYCFRPVHEHRRQ